MARTRAIFAWLYSLNDTQGKYQLTFESVPDAGISAIDLQARVQREAASLKQFQDSVTEINSLQDCHHWLFTKHTAYAPSLTPERVTDRTLNTY